MMSESRTESGRQEHFPVLFEGPLAVFAEGFVAWLLERGYRPRSVRVSWVVGAFEPLAGQGRAWSRLD